MGPNPNVKKNLSKVYMEIPRLQLDYIRI